MKHSAASILILLLAQISFLAAFPSPAKASWSWFIDARKYHISAHGQTSCQDCHEDIAGKALHPDPSKVTKKLSSFFTVGTCYACHDDVQDALAKGRHGGKKVNDPKAYTYCIRCHNPHYQLRLGKDRIGKFKPGIPREMQCSACHKNRTRLPAFSGEDATCMGCHRAVNPNTSEGRKKIQTFCFYCHAEGNSSAQEMTGAAVPLMGPGQYRVTTHAKEACTACHSRAAAFSHQDQSPTDCLKCHVRHPAKTTHAVHMDVACGACHLNNVLPFRDPEIRRVVWKMPSPHPGAVLTIHQMVVEGGQKSCIRCHFKGDAVGAPAMVLPAKGILCMPCHAATFSVGDTTTMVALLIFLLGVILSAAYWLTGSAGGKPNRESASRSRTSFSTKIPAVVSTLVLDVLLQRRLYRQSKTRWFVHAMIFYPFVFRFVWGLVALLGSLWDPASGLVWSLLDKNYFLTAALFDASGVLILIGILAALIRGTLKRSGRLPGLPRKDPFALVLIGGIVVVGFVLEGMRMAMTGWPGASEYAFAGYWISRLFSNPSGLASVYGYVWYAHAVLTGAFVAYLPFSRLFHIVMAPVVLVMGAGNDKEHRKGNTSK